jgi:hypothetical protein
MTSSDMSCFLTAIVFDHVNQVPTNLRGALKSCHSVTMTMILERLDSQDAVIAQYTPHLPRVGFDSSDDL